MAIPKVAPIFDSAALWMDADGRSFYSYDGGNSFTVPFKNDTANQLWRFQPVDYYGKWSRVSQPAKSNFSTLNRIVSGTYAYGNGLGFALGGWRNKGTDASLSLDSVEVAGMVIYNTTSREWFNVSTTGYSTDGKSSRGSAQFVPQYGENGLLFVLGGDINELFDFVQLVSI